MPVPPRVLVVGTGNEKTLPRGRVPGGAPYLAGKTCPELAPCRLCTGRLSWHRRAGPSATLDSAIRLCADPTEVPAGASSSTSRDACPTICGDARPPRALRRRHPPGRRVRRTRLPALPWAFTHGGRVPGVDPRGERQRRRVRGRPRRRAGVLRPP